MAAENPEIIPILEGVWTKIASDMKSGFVHITMNGMDAAYFQSHRITEVPAADPPDALLTPDDDDFEGAAIYYRQERTAGKVLPVGGANVSSTVGRDIYIYSWGADGEIRLDRGD